MIFFFFFFFWLYLLSWMTWSLLTSTCRFKNAPRPLNQRSDKSKFTQIIGLCLVNVSILAQGKSLPGFKKGHFLTETNKQRSILQPKSDLPCTRIGTTTSSLGVKCKQKHDLLLGIAYPVKGYDLLALNPSRAHMMSLHWNVHRLYDPETRGFDPNLSQQHRLDRLAGW